MSAVQATLRRVRDARQLILDTEAEAAAAAHDRGMTTAEIGELLGVSQPTAWRRVRDGRRLREEARRGA